MRMVENGFGKVYGRTGKMDGPRVDFAEYARSMGAHGFTIRTAEDFADIPQSMLRGNRPIVLDVEIDPAASFVDGGRNAALTNFKGK
jgi:thiamine pyrophosphate-dependent acetolactate synthase large subunit-like protein